MPPSSLYCCQKSVSRVSSAAGNRRIDSSPSVSLRGFAEAVDTSASRLGRARRHPLQPETTDGLSYRATDPQPRHDRTEVSLYATDSHSIFQGWRPSWSLCDSISVYARLRTSATPALSRRAKPHTHKRSVHRHQAANNAASRSRRSLRGLANQLPQGISATQRRRALTHHDVSKKRGLTEACGVGDSEHDVVAELAWSHAGYTKGGTQETDAPRPMSRGRTRSNSFYTCHYTNRRPKQQSFPATTSIGVRRV